MIDFRCSWAGLQHCIFNLHFFMASSNFGPGPARLFWTRYKYVVGFGDEVTFIENEIQVMIHFIMWSDHHIEADSWRIATLTFGESVLGAVIESLHGRLNGEFG